MSPDFIDNWTNSPTISMRHTRSQPFNTHETKTLDIWSELGRAAPGVRINSFAIHQHRPLIKLYRPLYYSPSHLHKLPLMILKLLRLVSLDSLNIKQVLSNSVLFWYFTWKWSEFEFSYPRQNLADEWNESIPIVFFLFCVRFSLIRWISRIYHFPQPFNTHETRTIQAWLKVVLQSFFMCLPLKQVRCVVPMVMTVLD